MLWKLLRLIFLLVATVVQRTTNPRFGAPLQTFVFYVKVLATTRRIRNSVTDLSSAVEQVGLMIDYNV
jgi:hypothetical protein